MAWDNYGNGAGIYRSTTEVAAETIQLSDVCDILEELRVGVNERIAITDLAYVDAFETGEGLTFDQAVAAVAALRAKIEALITTTTAYIGDAWPPTINYGALPIASLLLQAGYGSSWLSFERIQDGRIYEQIRGVIDAMVAIGIGEIASVLIDAEVYYGTTGGVFNEQATWNDAFNIAVPNMWGHYTQFGVWDVYTLLGAGNNRLSLFYLAERVGGSPGIRMPITGLRVIPAGMSLYPVTNPRSSIIWNYSVTIGGVPYNLRDISLRRFFNGTVSGNYINADVVSSLSADNPPPINSYGAISLNSPYLFDLGSTWTKKP